MSQKKDVQETILIVDDTPENLRLLNRILTSEGYKVRLAPSGAHALKTINNKIPDLILLDIRMPEMDGYEVCRRLKSDVRTLDIPVIFISALGDIEDKVKGFEVGSVDYITKPFQGKEVILRIVTHLKIRNLQQKLKFEKNRFKKLTDSAFEALLIHEKGTIIDVNPVAAKLFRCNETELNGTNLMDFVAPEIQFDLFLKQTPTIESEIIVKGNTRIPVEIRTKSLHGDAQYVTAIRDLTYQKMIEQQKQQLLKENIALKTGMQDRFRFGDFIGRSQAMQAVYSLISNAAGSDFPVVIYGESGTGKELTARNIHSLSGRKNQPFVTVNCGAITESIFERELFGHRKGTFTDAVRDEPGFFDTAHKGTLFLDEIGELSLAVQVKLLRVLEGGEYTPVGDVVPKKADIRIIVATNKNLSELVQQEKFRHDLFYRIHVIQITLPPLRERREDIPLLVEHTLSKHNAGEKMANLPPRLRDMLYNYDWPGNVRELINTVQRFLATDSIVVAGHPNPVSEFDPSCEAGLYGAVESLERRMIEDALQQTRRHRTQTAELLKIPRRTLQRKMQKLGLK